MVECGDLTLLAADAFAYERPRRDPRSSIRRPGSAIFVQYGRAPDLAPRRTSSLELENSPLGHLLIEGPRDAMGRAARDGNFVAASNRWSAAMPQPNDLSPAALRYHSSASL